MEQPDITHDFMNGEIVIIDKPLDWTSFDVVKRIRGVIMRKLKCRKLKVGHAGTLDPKASGLMILCTGKATKRIEEFQAFEKEYIARVKVGAVTPSYDLESEESEFYPTEHINEDLLSSVLSSFVGEIEQIPPVFSAIKVNGVRSFDLARKGKDVELQSRKVIISEIELLSVEWPFFEIKVVCSKGTYIRSLARDIGVALNSGAY
ncbi:MAG: tRNA pseudouridine(55) synthase TruB, partial [Bacteroidota bacterium]|nr:tRNA pseudouridine(55) synthase TruB [Bacteroidota bacterium]MDP4205447.1 tRNA pseudouridine(55) synthase TruB [Bacteroidota bacterium]